ncbi:MAG: trypsin-like peptidase domain-containing protein [Planctomycetota bacterium]|jgi:S1-C subfamily serine protease
MSGRFLILVIVGGALVLLWSTVTSPPAVLGEEVPRELREAPEQASTRSKSLSRPFIDATRKVRPAVVRIINLQIDFMGRLRRATSGSGFLVSKEGHILTNRHVILGARKLIVELADGRLFENVKKLGEDPRSDVGIVRIEGAEKDSLPVASLGDSDGLEVGEWVIAIGAPFELESSVSVGVVSATGRTGLLRSSESAEDFIQTDAALNPGNSGGPLMNLDGQVVGINTAIQTGGYSRANVGVGFAIPINLARTIAVSLIERGVAKRGWLGVSFDEKWVLAPELRRRGIDAQRGLRIDRVEAGSPAQRAGLQAGQIITKVDGRSLKSFQTFLARLAQAGPGGSVALYVHGDDGARDVSVELGEEQLRTYGIEVSDLTPSRSSEMGLPRGTRGALVTRILPGSVAARVDKRNRLMPGDVIVLIQWRGGKVVIQDKKDFDQVMARLQAEPAEVIRIILQAKDARYQVFLRP